MNPQIFKDRKYWTEIGEIIKCELCGFTERYSGSFIHDNSVIQIPGWLAIVIKELHDKR